MPAAAAATAGTAAIAAIAAVAPAGAAATASAATASAATASAATASAATAARRDRRAHLISVRLIMLAAHFLRVLGLTSRDDSAERSSVRATSDF